jgi:phospholipase/carboxylesterase
MGRGFVPFAPKSPPVEAIVTWRLPAKRGPRTPLVLLLHGRGADEHDLIDVADALPPAFAYASARAPVALPGGGYNWFEDRGVARPVTRSLRGSIDGVRAWLDGPDTAAFNRERTYLFGFSAGMMMGGALLLDDPDRFAGAVLLSGAIAFDADVAVTPQRLAGKPIFYGYGTFDDVIPAERVERSVKYLREQSGAVLAEHDYPHGHGISDRELADIRAWLEGVP